MAVTAHHILYERSSWESQPHTKKLRQMPQLIVPLEEEYHQILHREVPSIPLLDRQTSSHVTRLFEPTQRYSKNMPRLLLAIDEAAKHPRCTELQRDLAHLTIRGIELTIPWIHMGQVTDQVGGHYRA